MPAERSRSSGSVNLRILRKSDSLEVKVRVEEEGRFWNHVLLIDGERALALLHDTDDGTVLVFPENTDRFHHMIPVTNGSVGFISLMEGKAVTETGIAYSILFDVRADRLITPQDPL